MEPLNDLGQPQRREVALAVLANHPRLSRRAGQFLGGCVADEAPLTDRQLNWMLALAEAAGVEVAA